MPEYDRWELLTLRIHLLGVPRIERDGASVVSPRGNKSWALLAYLVLGEASASRSRLAEVLFPEADDPLAALRWTLVELRRALGIADALRGDPLTVPSGAWVDAAALQRKACALPREPVQRQRVA